jgi:hypothetical protein
MTPSGCQIFPRGAAVVSDRLRPSDHPAVAQECPAHFHERPSVIREGPAVFLGRPAAPSPVDRRRAVVRGRPADRAPPPLFPTRMASSSPLAASPNTGQDPPATAPPPTTAPPPPPLTAPPPLATDTSSPHRSGRMEAEDRAAGAAPAWLVFFFFFFKM